MPYWESPISSPTYPLQLYIQTITVQFRPSMFHQARILPDLSVAMLTTGSDNRDRLSKELTLIAHVKSISSAIHWCHVYSACLWCSVFSGVVSFSLNLAVVALIWHLLTVLLCAPFPSIPSQALDQPGQVQSIAILSALHLRRTMWSLNFVQTIFSNVFFEVSFLISKLHKSSESHE